MSTSESPIEEDFLAALLSVCPQCVLVPPPATQFALHNMAMDDEKREFVFVAPQMRVGPYRADFVFAAYHTPMYPRFLCVECDGSAYHLATENQIRRDFERDRFFEGSSFGVKRFSGSQLKRDPYACAREAVELVTSGAIARGEDGFQPIGHALANTIASSVNYSFDVDRFDAQQKRRRKIEAAE